MARTLRDLQNRMSELTQDLGDELRDWFKRADAMAVEIEELRKSRDDWKRLYEKVSTETTDDLLGEIALLQQQLAAAEAEHAREKASRVHWQDLAYAGMNLVDHLDGRLISRDGATEDNFKARASEARRKIRQLHSAATWGEEAQRKLELIDKLRAEEGDAVTIVADNADFDGPNCLIICEGGWTDHNERRFYGDTLSAAMEQAVAAREALGAQAGQG